MGLQRTHKRADKRKKELHEMSGQKTQVLLTMVLGKHWPAGPFLNSLFYWDSEGVGKLKKLNPRWEKTRSQKCLSLIIDLLSVAGLSRGRERNFSLTQDWSFDDCARPNILLIESDKKGGEICPEVHLEQTKNQPQKMSSKRLWEKSQRPLHHTSHTCSHT